MHTLHICNLSTNPRFLSDLLPLFNPKKKPLPLSKKVPFLSIKDPVSQSTPCPPLPKTSFLHSKKDPQSIPFQKGTKILKKRTLSSPERTSQLSKKGHPPFPNEPCLQKAPSPLSKKDKRTLPPPHAPPRHVDTYANMKTIFFGFQ
jgi:hypothetical protein